MAVRSENEIIQAISILTGVELVARAEGEQLPMICLSWPAMICLALRWATGRDNEFGKLIEGFRKVWEKHGTGIADDGRPYDLNRTN